MSAPETKPSRAVHWLCCALMALVGVTRHVVICEDANGRTHLELSHSEGTGDHHSGCRHDHVHVVWAPDGDRGAGEESRGTDGPSVHTHLDVDVGPTPPDGAAGAACDAPHLAHTHRGPPRWSAPIRRPPPKPLATGPPPPGGSSHLAQRASVVLLI